MTGGAATRDKGVPGMRAQRSCLCETGEDKWLLLRSPVPFSVFTGAVYYGSDHSTCCIDQSPSPWRHHRSQSDSSSSTLCLCSRQGKVDRWIGAIDRRSGCIGMYTHPDTWTHSKTCLKTWLGVETAGVHMLEGIGLA